MVQLRFVFVVLFSCWLLPAGAELPESTATPFESAPTATPIAPMEVSGTLSKQDENQTSGKR